MTDWTKYVNVRKGYHRLRRTRGKSSKQEQSVSVAKWEKQFIREVGSMPWKRLVNNSKSKYWYYISNRIVEWNDSAGEEAFREAKFRYWLKVNGHPCDIPMPNPDMYIDEIDWNKQ